MLEKTKGIVLHQFRYTDSGIVGHIYTRKFGRVSLLFRGMGKKRSGKHNIMLQPLFILDIEMYYKPAREMQLAREFNLAGSPFSIQADIRKSTVALFLGEFLSSVLREESPQDELFDYMENAIEWFDNCTDNFTNFHISFLTRLSSYLGFEPSRRVDAAYEFFDMRNGIFVKVAPVHGDYCDKTISGILSEFFDSSLEKASRISMNGRMRNEVIEAIIRYYSLHLPALKKLNSLDILKEVFS